MARRRRRRYGYRRRRRKSMLPWWAKSIGLTFIGVMLYNRYGHNVEKHIPGNSQS